MKIQTITGTVYQADGTVWANAGLEFQLDSGDGQFAGPGVPGVTDADGNFSVQFYNNAPAACACLVRLPDDDIFSFSLDPSESTVAIGSLRATSGVGAARLTEIYPQADNELLKQRALGSNILAQTLPAKLLGTTGISLSTGVAYFRSIYLPRPATITGVKWIQNTQGDYTASDFNGVALYTFAAGVLTRVAVSADDGNIWKAAGSNAVASKAFAATYAAAAGVLFIGYMYCRSAAVTAPQIAGGAANSSSHAALDYTNSSLENGTLSGQTALPSSQALSALTGLSFNPWLALY